MQLGTKMAARSSSSSVEQERSRGVRTWKISTFLSDDGEKLDAHESTEDDGMNWIGRLDADVVPASL